MCGGFEELFADGGEGVPCGERLLEGLGLGGGRECCDGGLMDVGEV